MQPVKVLHFELSSKLGGIESFLYNVYRNIDRKKIQFDFVTSVEHAALEDDFKKMGAKVYYIKRKNILTYFLEIKQLLIKNKYEVVHIHKNSAANIIPLLVCKYVGIEKIIVHAHNTNPSKGNLARVLHYINRPILNRCNVRRLACSDKAAHWLFGNNTDAMIINNGIEIYKYQYNSAIRKKKREKLGFTNDDFILGNVGRMTQQKNQLFLLDIFYEVRTKYKKSKLIICGNGELEKKIQEKIVGLGLIDDVLLLGVRRDINEILQVMDVFVMPSLYEGLPVAAIEAQGAGLPVIASDTVSKQTNILASYCNVPLSESAQYWARVILDKRTYFRNNTTGCITKAGFNIEYTAGILENLYLNK